MQGGLLLLLDILEAPADRQVPGRHSPHDIIHQVLRGIIHQAKKVIAQEEVETEGEVPPIISYLPLQE